MSDWEELEKELAGLTPRAPSKDFSKRVEDALGEAGSVAMRHTPDHTPDSDPARTTPSIHLWIPLGLAALLVFSLYLFNQFPSELEDGNSPITFLPEPSSMVDDEDSPLHGVTSEQLEDLSGVPVDGWLDPSTQERLIRRMDRGPGHRFTCPSIQVSFYRRNPLDAPSFRDPYFIHNSEAGSLSD
jgi:hypothetical protein